MSDIPVRIKKPYDGPAPGDRVRIRGDGATFEFVRRNECATYLRRAVKRVVSIVDRRTGETREFEAESGRVEAYAAGLKLEVV